MGSTGMPPVLRAEKSRMTVLALDKTERHYMEEKDTYASQGNSRDVSDD
jgi:hypothetical protein